MATKMLCLTVPTVTKHQLLAQSLQKGGGNSIIISTRRRRYTIRAQTKNSNLIEQRPSPNFQPNMWSYDYLQSLEIDLQVEPYKDKSKLLEVEVRSMIRDKKATMVTIIALVNNIQRLGLSHRFQGDIRSALDRVVSIDGGVGALRGLNLHETALCFRILRQHGFQVFQEVFTKFKDEKGGFQESLQEETEGILSLYEASHLAMEGETILDDAKAFTRSHLEGLKMGEIANSEMTEVSHALDFPLHHRIERQETRWSIENWIKKGDRVNQALLELAVLDFNLVQAEYQRDIGFVTRWWRGFGVAERLSFSRDRIMESFFWSVGLSCSPRLTSCRIAMAKLAQLITTIDDVFDVYGTLEELELFSQVVERWDIHAVGDLPDYMKLSFLPLYNTINEMGFEILKEQQANAIPYFAKAWTDICKAFLQEARWNYKKSMPSFEEYVENGWLSCSGPLFLVHAYFWLGQGFSKQQLQFLENYHELLRLPSLIFRFCNDLATSSAEIARGETVNSVACYMNDTGVSEEEAREHIKELIEEAWKKMNKYLVAETPFPKVFVETAMNLARISQLHYQHGDGHGAPDAKATNRVQSLVVESILMAKKSGKCPL